MVRYVVGLVGPMVSGKGTVASYLEEIGFNKQTISNIIRAEIRSRGGIISRTELQNVGNELRQNFGNDIWAKKAIATATTTGAEFVVIDGIRNLGEINYVRENFNSLIVGVDAPVEARLKWCVNRARERGEDPVEPEAFYAANARDREENLETGQQVKRCLEAVDITLENGGDIDDLLERFSKEFAGRVKWNYGSK